METNIYRIKDVAEMTGVHAQTLRNWEKEGLINPMRVSGNHRFYTEKDINQIKEIMTLKEEGLRLKGIQNVFSDKLDLKSNIRNNTTNNPTRSIKNNVQKNNVQKNNVQKTKVTPIRNPKYNEQELSELSITDLLNIAKEENIKYFRQMRKDELITAIAYPNLREKLHEEARERTQQKYGKKVYGAKKEQIEKKQKENSMKTAAMNLPTKVETRGRKRKSELIPENIQENEPISIPVTRNESLENTNELKETIHIEQTPEIIEKILQLGASGQSSEEIMRQLIEERISK